MTLPDGHPHAPRTSIDERLVQALRALDVDGARQALFRGANPHVHASGVGAHGALHMYKGSLALSLDGFNLTVKPSNLSPEAYQQQVLKTVALLEMLTEAGASLDQHGPFDSTLLQEALFTQNTTLMDWILKRAPHLMHAQGRGTEAPRCGGTAMHTLAYVYGTSLSWTERVRLGQWLCTAGLDLEALNAEGQTPLQLAVAHTCSTGVQALISLGASTGPAPDGTWPFDGLFQRTAAGLCTGGEAVWLALLPSLRETLQQHPNWQSSAHQALMHGQAQVRTLLQASPSLTADLQREWQAVADGGFELATALALEGALPAGAVAHALGRPRL